MQCRSCVDLDAPRIYARPLRVASVSDAWDRATRCLPNIPGCWIAGKASILVRLPHRITDDEPAYQLSCTINDVMCFYLERGWSRSCLTTYRLLDRETTIARFFPPLETTWFLDTILETRREVEHTEKIK